ncbi:hypothetical protein Shyd_57790 [Streptomyces hydrogenans]|uniref:Uncharacterized protein n=1 Tax=Streptomyces hydrogenans TaxID=1873719 RepID=A0ABQ3PHA4_9ACTN|nr:hypothetical protein Shyd_57790 [Streptomyces hydrogenans]
MEGLARGRLQDGTLETRGESGTPGGTGPGWWWRRTGGAPGSAGLLGNEAESRPNERAALFGYFRGIPAPRTTARCS